MSHLEKQIAGMKVITVTGRRRRSVIDQLVQEHGVELLKARDFAKEIVEPNGSVASHEVIKVPAGRTGVAELISRVIQHSAENRQFVLDDVPSQAEIEALQARFQDDYLHLNL